ncbi:MAG TPA: hypothetical protein VGH38_32290 [Bryobacteraceae bacterium]
MTAKRDRSQIEFDGVAGALAAVGWRANSKGLELRAAPVTAKKAVPNKK